MRELKKWELRPARGSQKHPALSGKVYIVDEIGKGFCTFRFSDDFVEDVGRALPQGISPEHPAFIKAIQVGKFWRIYAYYIGTETCVLLWTAQEKPSWIDNIRRNENASKTKPRNRRYPAIQEAVRRELRGHLRSARGDGS